METKLFVAYYRVSTARQGEDGYGMEAQKQTVARYLSSINPPVKLVSEFVEVDSGGRNDRPKALEAIKQCQKLGATLIISKTDRILRDIEFLVTLRKSGIKFYCCDNPNMDAFSLVMLCGFAEKERNDISARTKAGLAVAKARGVKLGNPNPENALKQAYAQLAANKLAFAQTIYPHIQAARADKKGRYKTLRDYADYLKLQDVKTARGKTDWTASAVYRILQVVEAVC